MDVDKVEVGQTLYHTSRIDGQQGPTVRVTAIQGRCLEGIVLDAKESPYTVGLPFIGLIRDFSEEEYP